MLLIHVHLKMSKLSMEKLHSRLMYEAFCFSRCESMRKMNPLKNGIKLAIQIVILCTLTANLAAEENVSSKAAQEFANQMQRHLPIVSEESTWESVRAEGRYVYGTARYHYNRKDVERMLIGTGRTIEEYREFVEKVGIESFCEDSAEAREAFFSKGVYVKLIYLFSDGEKFSEIDIRSCQTKKS